MKSEIVMQPLDILDGHKAIEVKWTFKFKKKIVKKKVELVDGKIQDQVADIFTKHLKTLCVENR